MINTLQIIFSITVPGVDPLYLVKGFLFLFVQPQEWETRDDKHRWWSGWWFWWILIISYSTCRIALAVNVVFPRFQRVTKLLGPIPTNRQCFILNYCALLSMALVFAMFVHVRSPIPLLKTVSCISNWPFHASQQNWKRA